MEGEETMCGDEKWIMNEESGEKCVKMMNWGWWTRKRGESDLWGWGKDNEREKGRWWYEDEEGIMKWDMGGEN